MHAKRKLVQRDGSGLSPGMANRSKKRQSKIRRVSPKCSLNSVIFELPTHLRLDIVINLAFAFLAFDMGLSLNGSHIQMYMRRPGISPLWNSGQHVSKAKMPMSRTACILTFGVRTSRCQQPTRPKPRTKNS